MNKNVPEEFKQRTRFVNTVYVWEHRGPCIVLFDHWTEYAIRTLEYCPDTKVGKPGEHRLFISEGVVYRSLRHFTFATPNFHLVVPVEDVRAILDGSGQELCVRQ